MTQTDQQDLLEAAARIMAHGAPLPRIFTVLVDQLVEARNGWRGAKPVDDVLDQVLDQITNRANVLRWQFAAQVLPTAAQAAAEPLRSRVLAPTKH
jgi:hypothetical protein